MKQPSFSMKAAEIDPSTLSYIEAHANGYRVGDAGHAGDNQNLTWEVDNFSELVFGKFENF